MRVKLHTSEITRRWTPNCLSNLLRWARQRLRPNPLGNNVNGPLFDYRTFGNDATTMDLSPRQSASSATNDSPEREG